MRVDKEARRQLAIANAKQPSVLAQVPREKWAGIQPDARRIEVWRSSRFLVQVYQEPGAVRLSVCRVNLDTAGRWQDGISWEELQQVKKEVGRGDLWAVELYPAESDLVNVANMRHLWVLTEAPPFGWKARP